MNSNTEFVAINYINCKEDYKERFEMLFATRAHAIDKMPGFQYMEVLKPMDGGNKYLIVSHWDSEESFKKWTKSSEFLEGHKRGFEDLKLAKENGEELPMTSDFKTYRIIAK